jgi:hypothetical protein
MRYNHSHRVGSDAGRNPKPYSAAPTIAMELNEYPRPANDTGIGVHWTVGYATAVGLAKIREFWLPELRSMGVKWVKIFNHDGALDFCELLLAEGFMPIVRLYRPNPNPWPAGRQGIGASRRPDARRCALLSSSTMSRMWTPSGRAGACRSTAWI